jgi:hypothetical protein
MSWTDWLPVTRGDLKNLWSYVMDQTEHITRIGEITMARVDELRARLAAATDELARDLEDLRGRLAQQDEALAAELEPMVARLEQMGTDPSNPVPDAPADGGTGQPAGDAGTGTGGAVGGGDVVNPTPGAADNPNENR